MKRFVSLFLTGMLLFFLMQGASGEVDTQWQTGQYVDEFDEPTGEEFASIRTEGTFSNTAAHKELLTVQVIADLTSVEFYMLEYGKYELTPLGKTSYTIRIKDNDDEIHEFTGHFSESTHRIVMDFPQDTVQGNNAVRSEVLSIFTKGGNIRFSITESGKNGTKYVFSIKNANNFSLIRKKAAKIAVNYMGECSEGIIPVVSDDKMGAINLEGEWIVPCEYDVVSACSDGMIRIYNGASITLDGGNRVINGTGKIGFYSADGMMAADCIYENARNYQDGFTFVKKNGKWGAIDKQGTVIIPFEYDFAEGISESRALVFRGETDKWGGPVQSKGKYTFVDITGTTIIDDLEKAYLFSEGLAAVCIKGKYGYIDPSGEWVIPAVYDNAYSFSEGRAFVLSGGTYSIIDRQGNVLATCSKKASDIKFLGNFHDGMVYVDNTDYRYGFINEQGKEVIPCQYKFVQDFENGYAPAKNENEKWGIIDKEGNTVVPFQYDEISRCGDYYSVRTFAERSNNGIGVGGTYGLIDTDGTVVLESRYLQLRYGDGYYTASTDDNWTILDAELNQVYPAE